MLWRIWQLYCYCLFSWNPWFCSENGRGDCFCYKWIKNQWVAKRRWRSVEIVWVWTVNIVRLCGWGGVCHRISSCQNMKGRVWKLKVYRRVLLYIFTAFATFSSKSTVYLKFSKYTGARVNFLKASTFIMIV